jgi:hypothetical protein
MAPRSDADDQGFDIENLPPPDDDDYDWGDDWDAPLTETAEERAERVERQAARRVEVNQEIIDLRQTIEDRRRHGAAAVDLQAEETRLAALEMQFHLGDPYELLDDEPVLVEQAAVKPRSDPLADFRAALETALSEDEHALLEAVRREEPQASIAARLGISQGAVSKREAHLRMKVNPIYRRLFGTDYSIIDRSRIPGRQGRRRKPQE